MAAPWKARNPARFVIAKTAIRDFVAYAYPEDGPGGRELIASTAVASLHRRVVQKIGEGIFWRYLLDHYGLDTGWIEGQISRAPVYPFAMSPNVGGYFLQAVDSPRGILLLPEREGLENDSIFVLVRLPRLEIEPKALREGKLSLSFESSRDLGVKDEEVEIEIAGWIYLLDAAAIATVQKEAKVPLRYVQARDLYGLENLPVLESTPSAGARRPEEG